MAGTFIAGETKVRPGAYFNIQKTGDNAVAGAQDGVVAVLFKSDFGPLCKGTEISPSEGYENIFGTTMTTDAIREAFAGGATKVIACRIGKGGTQATVKLLGVSDNASVELVSITAKHVGNKDFTISLREKLSDDTKKECVIYCGTREFEKVEFAAGEDEAAALVLAFQNSSNFIASAAGSGVLADTSQTAFTPGTNPTTTAQDYSDGLAAVELFTFNTICVDTEDTAIHAMLTAFVDRIFEVGQLSQAVVAEKKTVALADRMTHAAAFNSEKIVYVANANVMESGVSIDGYQTAARIAGMIAACPSSSSLTHTVVEGFTELGERLTPTQISKAETMGCLVLSSNALNQVWIDSAINTLITPSDNQDAGWKKIRRTKTRYELITRANQQADALIGKVDNDTNGRATIVSQVQGVGNRMIEEGKLAACTVTESPLYHADGDSAWFDIDCIDKDSVEHMYLTFKFRFSTQLEEEE